jgi:hypothetical protein
MECRLCYPALLLLALLVGCASKIPQTAAAQPGQSRQVDPAEDNRAVLGQLTPGLIMRLEIDGKTVQMQDPELVLIPRRAAARTTGGERVIVTGWRGREQVSAVSVSDQRINVQENVGIVIRDQRSLTVALPTPRRVDRVEVTLPGVTTPQEFSVAQVFDRACEQKPVGDLCR